MMSGSTGPFDPNSLPEVPFKAAGLGGQSTAPKISEGGFIPAGRGRAIYPLDTGYVVPKWLMERLGVKWLEDIANQKES